jgi:hypothetical protein
VRPLDEGQRGGVGLIEAGEEFLKPIADLRVLYGAPCDIVLLAVPPGEGFTIAHAARHWLQIEPELPAPQPKERND